MAGISKLALTARVSVRQANRRKRVEPVARDASGSNAAAHAATSNPEPSPRVGPEDMATPSMVHEMCPRAPADAGAGLEAEADAHIAAVMGVGDEHGHPLVTGNGHACPSSPPWREQWTSSLRGCWCDSTSPRSPRLAAGRSAGDEAVRTGVRRRQVSTSDAPVDEIKQVGQTPSSNGQR